MTHENEDIEIDCFLIEKIDKAITQLGEPKNLGAKPYSFKTEFANLLRDLKENTRRPRYTDDAWLGVRRGNLYTLNNLVTEWQQITKIQVSFSPKEVLEACENIKKSLRKMKKDVSTDAESSSRGDHDESRRNYPEQEFRYPTFTRHGEEKYRWSSRHEPRKVHGIEHRVLAMVRELVMRNTDAPFKVFGVVGAPGIGKTTFCQSLFGNKFVKEHFSPRIWVCLSKRQEDEKAYKEEIVIRMLDCLGIEDEVIEDARKGALKKLILLLRLQLIGKRYLIVLDDAWNGDEFFCNLTEKDRLDENWGEELAYGLPKGYGGTVVSSSRSKEVLQKMLGEDVSLQYMEPLNREIIYEIFKDAVIGYDDDERDFPKDLEQVKEELLNRCDGIPMAAKLLAKIAWKNLDIKPKSKVPKPQQTQTGGKESSHEQLIGGDHVTEIGDDQMA